MASRSPGRRSTTFRRALRLTGRSLPLLVVVLLAGCARGQPTYPQKPITLVVNFAPGGSSDLVARAVAAAATPQVGQEMVVVNKPGGNGTLGPIEVLQAKPDGYTFGISVDTAFTTAPHTIPNLPYGAPSDYDVLGKVGRLDSLLAARADAPYQSLAELVDYARANPGKLKLSSVGQPGASASHAAWMRFTRLAGIDVVYVPFTNDAEGVTNLLGGHVDFSFNTQGGILPHIREGTVRGLALWGPERSPELPDLRTFKELGYDVSWATDYVLYAPKGLPPAVRQTAVSAFEKAAQSASLQQTLTTAGARPSYRTPDQARAELQTDYQAMKDGLAGS